MSLLRYQSFVNLLISRSQDPLVFYIITPMDDSNQLSYKIFQRLLRIIGNNIRILLFAISTHQLRDIAIINRIDIPKRIFKTDRPINNSTKHFFLAFHPFFTPIRYFLASLYKKNPVGARFFIYGPIIRLYFLYYVSLAPHEIRIDFAVFLLLLIKDLFIKIIFFSSDFLLSSLSIILVSLSCIVSVVFSLKWIRTS